MHKIQALIRKATLNLRKNIQSAITTDTKHDAFASYVRSFKRILSQKLTSKSSIFDTHQQLPALFPFRNEASSNGPFCICLRPKKRTNQLLILLPPPYVHKISTLGSCESIHQPNRTVRTVALARVSLSD